MSTEDEKRERAVMLVHSLTILAADTRAPQGERDAAQARINHLRAKYKLTTPRDREKDILDELKRNEARNKANHDAWQARYEAQKRKKAEEDERRRQADAKRDADRYAEALRQERERARQQRDRQHPPQGDIFDEAIRRDGNRTTQQRNADMQNRFRNPSGQWDLRSKYHATITSAFQTTSQAGNAMVVVDYRIDGHTLRSYYVFNDRGLNDLLRAATTLLGSECRDWPLDRLCDEMVGKACTVMLRQWDDGRKWSVDTVMKPWS